MDEFFKKVDEEERDIFVKLRQVVAFKLELVHKHSRIIKFLERAVGEECNEVKSEIQERNKNLSESSYSKIFNNIDKTKFRDGVDVDKAINIIIWTLEGFGTSQQQKSKAQGVSQPEYEKIFSEMDSYINMFKNCFY